jgi:hypothetical protein
VQRAKIIVRRAADLDVMEALRDNRDTIGRAATRTETSSRRFCPKPTRQIHDELRDEEMRTAKWDGNSSTH